MNLCEQLLEFCLNKQGAYPDFPFGDETLLVKIAGHYFASFFSLGGKPYMTVKGMPDRNVFWRLAYPDRITRGYHCPRIQQPYNNTVALDGSISTAEFRQMIDDSYAYTLGKLTKKERIAVESEDMC